MEELTMHFVDFDGTIAAIDVCEALVTAFSRDGWQELNEKWEKKEISTLECAADIQAFKTSNPEDFSGCWMRLLLTPDFRILPRIAGANYPLTILSDGYDYYIEHILRREGLALPYCANKLHFASQLDVEAPYCSASCDLCGVCKLEIIEMQKKPGQMTVYIGDGYSDFCPAQGADLVFAKTRLYQHCQSVGKEAIHFNDFREVLLEFRKLSGEEGVK